MFHTSVVHTRRHNATIRTALIKNGSKNRNSSSSSTTSRYSFSPSSLQKNLHKLFSTQSSTLQQSLYSPQTPYWNGAIPSTESQILACSATTTLSKTLHQQRQIIKRVIQKVKTWIRKLWDAWLVFLRGAEVAARLSPLVILTPAAICYHNITSNNNNKNITTTTTNTNVKQSAASSSNNTKKNIASDLAWSYTIYTLQNLGPAFIKFAQWAATRRDLFPLHICEHLSTLHDNAHVHSWDYTQKTLIEAFGTEYQMNGLDVKRDNVIGSGSAAQVYRGTLTLKEKKKGSYHNYYDAPHKLITKDVAIKVLHPNIRSLVERDLLLMTRVADLIDSALPFEFIKMLSLPRAASNFTSVMRKQVDLRMEGENLETFNDYFNNNAGANGRRGYVLPLPWRRDSKTIFPRPYQGWVAHNVLVEEYIDNAKPIAEYIKDDSEKGLKLRKELAGPLLRAFLKMVFLDNFVHGDLHPGNVLVQTTTSNGASTSSKKRNAEKHTVVFLDAGIATSLSPRDQQNLIDLFRAVIFNDGDRAGRLMVERARHERCSQVEGGVDAFAAGIDSIVSDFHDRRKEGLTLGTVRIGTLLGRVLDLCRIHGVEIDPAMATIVLSTLVLEGLGRSLDPDLDLMHLALPFVVSWDNMRRLSQSQFLQVFNHWLLGF